MFFTVANFFLLKICYSVALLVYIHSGPENGQNVLEAETVIASLKIVLGLFGVYFGYSLFRKLSIMKVNRRSVMVIGKCYFETMNLIIK